MTSSDSAALEVENTLLRALAILRVVVLVNSMGLAVLRHREYAHPQATLVVMVALAVWTALALWAYSRPAWRRAPLLVADLAVAVGTMALSPLVKGPQMNATLPGFWVAGVVLAWAIVWRLRGGIVAAIAISVTDVLVRNEFTQTNYANLFLIVLGGIVVGYLTQQVVAMARDRARAERMAATAAERARLARVVHDGVLQVLALVQRRGAEIGGEAAQLGVLAGEQEVALRALVQRPDPDPDTDTESGEVDLAAELAVLETRTSPRVQVTTLGGRIPMPPERAHEMVALVRACLHNISDHVGEHAPAWVLLEDEDDRIRLSVRDDGPGIPPGRLAEAEAAGRLGVVESIRGRAAGLGGTATVTTAPGQGTEWEFVLPKEIR